MICESDNEVQESDDLFKVERSPENSEVFRTVASLEVAAATRSGSESRRDNNFYSAAEAIKMQSAEMDMRPYIFDSNSKEHILWDSGSQVCACPQTQVILYKSQCH